MPKSVHITTPPLSLEEIAKRLRIPKAKQKALRAVLDEAWSEFSRQADKPSESAEPEKRRKRASAA